MQHRFVMNTKSLRKNFGEVYSDFFSRHDMVLGACNVMTRGSGIGESDNIIRIKQKVPTKSYCGINFNNTGEVRLGKVMAFNLGKFEEIEFKDINKQYIKIQEYLQEILDDSDFDKGLEINFISENPRGHGFGFGGVSGVLIGVALSIITQKLSMADLNNVDGAVPSSKFDMAYKIGAEIDNMGRYGNATGANSSLTLMNTSLPVVSFVEKKDHKVYKSKIMDFLKLNNQALDELNIDYGIIYLGTENKSEHCKHIRENTQEYYEKNRQFLLNVFEKNDIKDIDKMQFGKTLSNSLYEPFTSAMSVLSFELLTAFNDLLSNSFDEHNVDRFMNVAQKNYHLSCILEQSNPLIDLIKSVFENSKKISNEKIILFPTNQGKTGGSYIFVTKFNKSRNTIDKVFEELHKIGHDNVMLEYASWIDGNCGDGVILEQYVSAQKFSDYVKKDKIFFKNNQGESYVGDYNDIVSKLNKGLVLDAVKNKIYLNGRKLTSQDIHSQTTTINILGHLLDRIGDDINNKDFEISSYSKNKNEMLSKIVLPLISLLEQETDKKLPLICKGSIYDFYIKLNPTDIVISIIKKM